MSCLTKRIVFIGAMILISLLGLAIGLRSGSASVVGKPAPSPVFMQAAGQCPPSTTIHGTLGSGSPDYPATSGQQTGRIVNGLGNITCGSSNPCSLNTTTGSRAFDAYTFTNTGAAACVSVTFTMSGCALNQAMQFSARLGSFDAANPCANYSADGGAGFSGEFTGANSKTFSFNVAAGQSF